jgi:hypothetical protein
MPMPDIAKLTAVFEEARRLTALPDNNFDWSSWFDAAHALKELDALLATLHAGTLPPASGMSILFLPTGPLQEVSQSSGWGDEFIDLANRFDEAMDNSD